jgi:hypothetical protein
MEHIEGIPEGWELVRIGKIQKSEWFLGYSGNPVQADHEGIPGNNQVIVRRIKRKVLTIVVEDPGFEPAIVELRSATLDRVTIYGHYGRGNDDLISVTKGEI